MTARRAPRWLHLALGVACVALGGVLIADPFRSLSLLRALLAGSLLCSGGAELLEAASSPRPRLARAGGGALVLGGLLAIRPGLSLGALAVATGLGLIAVGVTKLLEARVGTGDRRFLDALNALTSTVVGLLALAWPAVTVLVLAILLGIRTILFGFAQIAGARRMRFLDGEQERRSGASGADSAWPPAARWVGTLSAFVLALAGMGVSVVVHDSGPPRPGPFYDAPSPLPPGPPGTVIRSELIRGLYPGTKAYRVLYKSTGFDGRPAAVSGIVVIPEGAPPAHGRKVIAFAHGTVGIASNCAPSLQNGGFSQIIEGLGGFIAAGYVVAATDYRGLGTPGPHPYLIGRVEAMNVLDSVRAARRLRRADAGVDFAVWGHSQGGHASLFTGELASAYAPELHLVGVAAGAPVPDLVELFKANVQTRIGRILIAMALRTWEQVYADARLERVLTPSGRQSVGRIAAYCLYGRQFLRAVPDALILGMTFLSRPPWETEPWRTIALQNTPGGAPTSAPLLLTQGTADKIVPASATQQLAKRLCARGETVDLRLYPSVEHVEAGIVVAPDVTAWIADRFAGRPAPTTCR